jgi:hypothetical protein
MTCKVFARFSVLVRVLLFALLAALLPANAQAAKWYYDNALGEVGSDEKVEPAQPAPVQLLFEFQTNGKPNARATKVVKPWAVEDLKGTGAFTEVVDAPAANGAVLSIKFNDVVDPEELKKLKKQAFGAGFSFGLFSGVVAVDHYVVTFEYIPSSGSAPITTEVNHAVYMKYGKTDVEIPGTEVKKADQAIKTVVRQALERGVNNVFAELAQHRPAGEAATSASIEEPAAADQS